MKRENGSKQMSQRVICKVKAHVANPYFEYGLISLIEDNLRVLEDWNINPRGKNVSKSHLLAKLGILLAD